LPDWPGGIILPPVESEEGEQGLLLELGFGPEVPAGACSIIIVCSAQRARDIRPVKVPRLSYSFAVFCLDKAKKVKVP
jgi:hypothetical protein